MVSGRKGEGEFVKKERKGGRKNRKGKEKKRALVMLDWWKGRGQLFGTKKTQ